MVRSRFQALFSVLLFIISTQLFSQETSKSEQNSTPQDFFTFGLSYNQLNAGGRFTRVRFTPMFSASYSHKFSPILDVEATANITGSSNTQYGIFGGAGMTSTLTGDLTALFTPFAGQSSGLERLRIGAGFSLQNNTLSATAPIPSTSGFELRDVYSSYSQWGAHLKVDYLFPLSANVDLGLRGQAHIFGPSAGMIGNYPVIFTQSYTPQLSLGGFIRFGW
ncbi:MAG: hypothetical protein MUF71_14375 [Candidatus Kapabacteria bacterium]|jgi:hypothetical protein|nr:hypothetical protein [Candidatus Kapabacteria bacterium]